MPRKRRQAAIQQAAEADNAERQFAASVEALLRAKARVPLTPATGLEIWSPGATLTRLAQLATYDSIEQITDDESAETNPQ